MNREFHARLNYPDPFKPVGIEFHLPEKSLVTVKIFQSDGKEVKTIIENEPYPAGLHTLPLQMDNFLAGGYVCRVSAKGENHEFTETKRL